MAAGPPSFVCCGAAVPLGIQPLPRTASSRAVCAVSEAPEGTEASKLPFHAPNVWPDPAGAPLFRPALLAYRDALLVVRNKCVCLRQHFRPGFPHGHRPTMPTRLAWRGCVRMLANCVRAAAVMLFPVSRLGYGVACHAARNHT